MDQQQPRSGTTTSAGTAQTSAPAPRFVAHDIPASASALHMHTADGSEVQIDGRAADSIRLAVVSDSGAWLNGAEAAATGRELLRAAGAPDEAQKLREQRDELIAALVKIVKYADSEPDGGDTVEMHRANIERARAAIARATGVEAA